MEETGITCRLDLSNNILYQEKISRSSSIIGEIGSMYARSIFLLLGYNVYKPEVEGRSDDFIIERNGVFNKIQCKSTCNKKNFSLNLTRRTNWTGKGYYKSGDFDYIVFVSPHGLYAIRSEEIIGRKSFTVQPRHKIYDGIPFFT